MVLTCFNQHFQWAIFNNKLLGINPTVQELKQRIHDLGGSSEKNYSHVRIDVNGLIMSIDING